MPQAYLGHASRCSKLHVVARPLFVETRARVRGPAALVATALAACSGEATVALIPDAGEDASVAPPPPPSPPPDASSDAPYDGPPPKAELAPVEVDFGAAACGGPAPASRTVAVTNRGLLRLKYTARTSEPAAFVVKSPTTGSIGVGQTAEVTVLARGAPPSAEPGQPVVSALYIDLDDTLRTGTLAVPLRLTPVGAKLVVLPASVSFGVADVGSTKSLEVSVENRGTQPVIVTIAQPPDPALALVWTAEPAPVQLAPGAFLAGAAVRFRPTTTGVRTGTVTLHTSGVVCGDNAPTIALVGTGSAVDGGADAAGDAAADGPSDAGGGGGGGG
jgi:hypothetical protein